MIETSPNALNTDFEPVGEGLDEDLGRPVARDANRQARAAGESEFVDLGEDGQWPAADVRFRDSAMKGFLTIYKRSRESVEGHPVVTISIGTIAIGTVLAGFAHKVYRSRKQ